MTTPRTLTKNTTPTLTGTHGRAWIIDLDAAARRRSLGPDPRREVTLPCWIVEAAYAHPVWSNYAILAVALREVPGVPKAVIHAEGATHELMLFALDPDHPPAVDDLPRMLQPVNFAAQFTEADDAAAAARVQQAVQDICDAKLNPDTDYRATWAARFSASNLKPGALVPDVVIASEAGILAVGTGASNARLLDEIAKTQATMSADTTKPQ